MPPPNAARQALGDIAPAITAALNTKEIFAKEPS